MNALIEDVTKQLREGDSFAAIETIERSMDPRKISEYYVRLSTLLYGKKDLAGMIAIGRAGIQFCLGVARVAPPEAQTGLRTAAQMMCYNLAANLWPGWGDEGVAISPEQQAQGRDLAKADLRLALEMKRPPKRLSNAYWIAGAHAMAAKDFAAAAEHFKLAEALGREAGEPEHLLMIQGYAAMNEALAGKDSEAAAMQTIVKKLNVSTGKDGRFFAEQIGKAYGILSK
ncbi:MAG: hypothetical protein KIS92_05140 [Planctomycetota bacterium]|nr:hypothetical protein [Planctomycetota bacterium]